MAIFATEISVILSSSQNIQPFLKRYTPRLNFNETFSLLLKTDHPCRLLGDRKQFVSERGMGCQNKAKLSRKASDVLPSNDCDK